MLAVCLRLAALLLRRRADLDLGEIGLRAIDDGYAVEIDGEWLDGHPLTAYSLNAEASEWSKLGWKLSIRPRESQPA